ARFFPFSALSGSQTGFGQKILELSAISRHGGAFMHPRQSFEVQGRTIGDGARVFLIAELSANHGHKLDVAKKTIEAAARAGADAIKLQTYTPDTLTIKSDAPHFVVRTKNVWSGRTLHDLYGEAMTPWEWHAELKSLAESLGLICFSTPFDPTAVEF